MRPVTPRACNRCRTSVVLPYELPHTPSNPQPLRIWHFDFYRFNDPREWEDAGFRDIFASSGLKLAEWPDKAAAFVPRADLAIRINVQLDGVRLVQLIAHTPTGVALLAPVSSVSAIEGRSCP